MNFIDALLDDLDTLSADDLIQALSGIYAESVPFSELAKYPQFIRDVVFIIDLDTELTMNGDVLVNRAEYVPNMIEALENICADNDAALLRRIYELHEANPDYEAIWQAADALYRKMYFHTDADIWPLLETYVEREMKSGKKGSGRCAD